MTSVLHQTTSPTSIASVGRRAAHGHIVVLGALLGVLSSPVWAQEPQTPSQEGRHSSLEADAIQDNPVSQAYESAISAWWNGDLQQADTHLRQLLDKVPYHAGAWLDLALLQCDLGREQLADQLFREIETRFLPPVAILELIARRRLQGCRAAAPPSRRLLRFRLGRGGESNVNQGASQAGFTLGSGDNRLELMLLPAYLPRADQFTQGSAEYLHQDTNHQYFVQVQHRQHDRWSAYDSAALLAGTEWLLSFRGAPLRLGGGAGGATLGGQWYQQHLQFHVAVPLNRYPRNGWQWETAVAASLVQYPQLSGFDATVWEWRGQGTYQQGHTRLVASGAALLDQAQGGRPGGTRHGWQAGVRLRTPLFGDNQIELAWLEQAWNSHQPYSPGLIDTRRIQRTRTLQATLSVPLDRRQALIFEYRQLDNRENISIFRYNSQRYQVGWQWTY